MSATKPAVLKKHEDPRVEAVLQAQQSLETVSREIETIDAKIEELDARILTASDGLVPEEKFDQDLEALQAASALGEVTQDEARRRSDEIARAKKAAQEKRAVATTLEATRNGLSRKLEQAKTERVALREELKDALEAFLLAEAEKIDARYVAAALTVEASVCELHAIRALLQQRTNWGWNNNLLGHEWNKMFLPAFNLPASKEREIRAWPGTMFSFELAGSTIYDSARTGLTARLRALGINLADS